MINPETRELLQTRGKLLGSLLLFTQWAYKLRTGREYKLSTPINRESHYITVSRALTDVFYGKSPRLIINIPPRYGKTELLVHFVAWTLAHYPDSNYLYISSSKDLATRATAFVRDIVTLPAYRKIFGVELRDDSSAKDHFTTTDGGSIEAIGTGGTITGKGAGIKGVSRFGGFAAVDDVIQADDAESDAIRESANEWHYNVLDSRLNNRELTPLIAIGQRLHEHDYCAYLKEQKMEQWKLLSLPALDSVGNALDPAMHPVEKLNDYAKYKPYLFASQFQQDPLPAGGGVFKEEWFTTLDIMPTILASFITVDTAETSKTYNDPTAMSFWGLYKVQAMWGETDDYALHCIDCRQIWVEPHLLESEVIDFISSCMRFEVKPGHIAIEKKSTGVTLASVLNKLQGIHIIDIERTKASGSKAARYIEMQPYVAKKLITLPAYAKHTPLFIEHMKKITLNDTHLRDDIADTAYDAVNIALIKKTIQVLATRNDGNPAVKQLISNYNNIQRLKRQAYDYGNR